MEARADLSHKENSDASVGDVVARQTQWRIQPLFVDLDGTLVKTDVFIEGILTLLKKNPLYIFLLPLWLVRGRAYTKERIASFVPIIPDSLPYHKLFLQYLRQEKALGRPLILLTGAPRAYAEAIATHLAIFDRVHTSTRGVNLTGHAKVLLIRELYGNDTAFAYAGNSRADLPVWRAAHEAILVNAPQSLAASLRQGPPIAAVFGDPNMSVSVSFVKAIRVYQWVKNALLFVPLLTAHQWPDWSTCKALVTAFFAFSFCASSVYVLNDLLDLSNDRRHPSKCKRPFAAGDLSLSSGLLASPLLLLAGLGLASQLSMAFLLMLVSYYIVTLAYSLKLKEKVLIDVIVLALLYNWRILSGAVTIGVEPSPWLLGFACFLFYSLALAKRSSELILLKSHDKQAVAGRGYILDDLIQVMVLGAASGMIAVLVLALYINSYQVQTLYPRPVFLWPVCLALLYWISRIWLLTGRGKMHQDPLVFALKDPPSYGVGLIVLVLAALATAPF